MPRNGTPNRTRRAATLTLIMAALASVLAGMSALNLNPTVRTLIIVAALLAVAGTGASLAILVAVHRSGAHRSEAHRSGALRDEGGDEE